MKKCPHDINTDKFCPHCFRSQSMFVDRQGRWFFVRHFNPNSFKAEAVINTLNQAVDEIPDVMAKAGDTIRYFMIHSLGVVFVVEDVPKVFKAVTGETCKLW